MQENQGIPIFSKRLSIICTIGRPPGMNVSDIWGILGIGLKFGYKMRVTTNENNEVQLKIYILTKAVQFL